MLFEKELVKSVAVCRLKNTVTGLVVMWASTMLLTLNCYANVASYFSMHLCDVRLGVVASSSSLSFFYAA